MAEIRSDNHGMQRSGSMTPRQRAYAIENAGAGNRAPSLTPEERAVGERCGAYTGSEDWFNCKNQVDRRGEDLGATVNKVREALLKDNAARQSNYDKAMKAADAHTKAGDKIKAAAELQKAYDAADETGECLQVAKKAASLDLRELAAKALWGARNIADSPAASEHVAKTAESLGFDGIAIWAKDDAEETRQKKAVEQAKEQTKKAKEQTNSKPSNEPAPKSFEIRKSPLMELMTDPMALGIGALAYGAYLESKESGKKSGGGKTKRKR